MHFLGYIINAFTDQSFHGNPACVVILPHWYENKILQDIAKQVNLPETAFLCFNNDQLYLRWFTPDVEMDLCGHATLAAAYYLNTFLNIKKFPYLFNTCSGIITVDALDNLYSLSLPSRKGVPAKLPESIQNSLNIQPVEVYKSRDYLLVYKNQKEIENITIHKNLFDQINLDPGGVIVTAKGDEADFVSRFFTPQASILEDPVTGSAHCTLVPYWAERLEKDFLLAYQLSSQKGKLWCHNFNSHVKVMGKAQFDHFIEI